MKRQLWKLLMFQMIVCCCYSLESYKMPIYYLDTEEHCQHGTQVSYVTGGNEKSGIIYSHRPYGQPYPGGDRNCIITLYVQKEYHIRLTAMEFAVNGTPSVCDKDSLHVFDHDKLFDPKVLGDGPGRILGKYCGLLPNTSRLAESTHNALTIWWHPGRRDLTTRQGDVKLNRGFKLLWTAFRKTQSGHCNRYNEFRCRNGDCIYAPLACDGYAHCEDRSDTQYAMQKELGCEDLTSTSSASSLLHGIPLAIISIAIVLGSVICCVVLMICYRSWFGPNHYGTKLQLQQQQQQQSMLPLNPYTSNPVPGGGAELGGAISLAGTGSGYAKPADLTGSSGATPHHLRPAHHAGVIHGGYAGGFSEQTTTLLCPSSTKLTSAGTPQAGGSRTPCVSMQTTPSPVCNAAGAGGGPPQITYTTTRNVQQL